MSKAPMNELNGKVCLVTGASSGYGLAVVQTLAEKEVVLVLLGRNRVRSGTIRRPSPHSFA